jgi:hypothetical protein
MMITILTMLLVADMYTCKVSWGFGATRVGGGSKILLQVLKVLLCLLSPLKLVLFLEELKERESPDAES